ncbi:hypothetical protein CLU93_2704 [Janthinobacterium sp. 35]|uniref:hypothetical protein n=1 Tax=Janthinobacterium sp. 35 TaxID=2035210 RepID=UPI000C185F0B|nr:hypothetical protein [Janthinobacterium sp. 35]PIG28410.1 hypothetical protein CLU93_2704 [Janthinobacterium sp. 35]
MNSHHFDLPRLLRDTDALKVEMFPLPPHFAIACDEYTRLCHASAVAATLLADQPISEMAGRLFDMLLTSLGLAERRNTVWQMAADLNRDSLREFLQAVQQHQLASSFMLDVLVLCRLDGPLSQPQLTLLSELAELLQLPEDELLVLTFWAAKVLGLPLDTALPESCLVSVFVTMYSRQKKHVSGGSGSMIFHGFEVEKQFAQPGEMLAEEQLILISNEIAQGEKMLVREASSGLAGYLHKVLLKKGDFLKGGELAASFLPFPPAYAVWREAVGIPAVAP